MKRSNMPAAKLKGQQIQVVTTPDGTVACFMLDSKGVVYTYAANGWYALDMIPKKLEEKRDT